MHSTTSVFMHETGIAATIEDGSQSEHVPVSAAAIGETPGVSSAGEVPAAATIATPVSGIGTAAAEDGSERPAHDTW